MTPYEIKFGDIREGMTVEETTPDGSRTILVCARQSKNRDRWISPEGNKAIMGNAARTYRALAEPSKPALPTEGYIEVWGTPTHCDVEVHLVVATLDADGDWSGVTKDGVGMYLTPNQITCWNPVRIVPADDPSAPKADDGLRERVEKLADDFAINHESTSGDRSKTWWQAARSLRDALAEEELR